ncbi:zinc-binding dehydrogenase family oxidoreductase [Zopfochytrium polystomum]|nr:zinc-binding dehydrogenase family oxidoreductase [Zopfochytrium polystomum]
MKVVRDPLVCPIPKPPPNHIIIRNRYVSIDPTIRTRMQESLAGYLEPFVIGEPIRSEAIAEVRASSVLHPGDLIIGTLPWEDWSVVEISDSFQKLDPDPRFPLSLYLSVFGWPGQTAYFGLFKVGQPKKYETILVSAGAGAVGQIVGQLAKIQGLHVIGSAGNLDKVRFLKEVLRFDGAFYSHMVSIDPALAELAPRGIDIYFDSVGGHLLEGVLPHMNVKSRIALSGMISMYSDKQAPHSVSNLFFLITKQIRMEGFMIDRLPEDAMDKFMTDMARWYNEGRIVHKETVFGGLEKAPEALLSVFQKGMFGMVMVDCTKSF